MPAHNYTPIPLEDEQFSRSYNTGIPSTGPPSFRTVPPSSNSPLPYRNDSAATVTPRDGRFYKENTLNDDPANSIWAPSESQLNHDLEAAREDMLARLLTRLEQIEQRLDENRDECNEKAVGEEKEWSWGGWKVSDILTAVLMTCLLIWVCAMVTLWAAAYYRASGFPKPGSAVNSRGASRM